MHCGQHLGVTLRDSEANTLTTFRDLGVLPPIADALERVGITEPFPIQELALPSALAGSDLFGQARTGTGKTYAFGLALLQRVVSPDERDYAEAVVPGKPQALVIVPTRELALQVAGDLETASTIRRVRVLTVYGGRAYEPQLSALSAGVDVVVGTPGRLLDLANQGKLDLGQIKVLVLDEADKMLDLGFLPDVEKLISRTPELRQTMLFSATMQPAVVSLARRYMRNPLNIRAETGDEQQTVPTTAQFVYRAHSLDKDEMVARLLRAEGRGRTIVFSTTKRAAQRLTDELTERGFAAAAVHGDLSQPVRERALRAFRNGKVDVLVATDVAARGIDIEAVTHVVNLSCPDDEKTYLHRIGRTGRAGADGIAVTFVDWDDLHRWKLINEALDLPFADPPETYSSSEHFFRELGIPPGTKGRLPAAERTRDGLDAEEVDDADKGSERPGRQRRRTRRGSSGSHGGGQRTRSRSARSEPAVESTEVSESRPRKRVRRRTRAGQAVDLQASE
ncbi:DEAD/DEAH box helicase [Phytoactinopolyspora limicola]|uniref:DEAD/DEAH box helicase n=1 Tax=Phytoactinopolyspora limicola TaxID=2715536 RepID=UPI001FE5E177|nr:DEAD/DEAH box helicase [Phytoactinopolyspora limicola]